jgi:hypothetical protein
MALDQSALLEVLDALKVADVGDRVRQAAETVYQALIEAELTDTIGAALHERSDTRTAQRNGHRSRILSTTAGDLELRIPKLRTGSFFPSLLERRRRVDQALFAVVMEAYLHGVSTRKVDDLVKALGADTGISKSEVSRICADLDHEVGAFRDAAPTIPTSVCSEDPLFPLATPQAAEREPRGTRPDRTPSHTAPVHRRTAAGRSTPPFPGPVRRASRAAPHPGPPTPR